MLAGLARTHLLILDDWAMVKLTAEQRRDLMEVIDDRHGRGSTIIATQIPLDRRPDQIGEPSSMPSGTGASVVPPQHGHCPA